MTDIIDFVEALTQRILDLQAQMPSRQRLIVAVAGAPGSGKSTLAAEICQRLNQLAGPIERLGSGLTHDDSETDAIRSHQAVVVPMDGFHLDNTILKERGQIAVKGAPQTFDVNGLASLIRRLAEPINEPVYIPVFDRSMDLSRNAAYCVDERHGVVIVEGNYLLLARPGWQELAALFHLNVMLDVPMETLQKRLVQRWLNYGHEPEQALERALSNDIPNAKVVVQESSGAHLIYKSVRQ